MNLAIVFSRDRPAQLSLLLNSIWKNAPQLFPKGVVVLYRYTQPQYAEGYELARNRHPNAVWIPEADFRNDVDQILEPQKQHVTFLTDDDVFYRPFAYEPLPWHEMDLDPDLLTVSLRLGNNTTYCYPMNQEQELPQACERHRDMYKFLWRAGQWDFGYPGSLDGNVWHAATIKRFLAGTEFINPNGMEDVLVKACQGSHQQLMGCYRLSTIVNIPANLVNVTHRNRHSDRHDTGDLNRRYLEGKQLALNMIDLNKINSPHCERELIFSD